MPDVWIVRVVVQNSAVCREESGENCSVKVGGTWLCVEEGGNGGCVTSGVCSVRLVDGM